MSVLTKAANTGSPDPTLVAQRLVEAIDRLSAKYALTTNMNQPSSDSEEAESD